MRQSLKIAISLLASLLLFAGFAVVAFSGLFNVLQVSFFLPGIERAYQSDLASLAVVVERFHAANLEAYRLAAGKDFVSASFSPTLSDATIKAWSDTTTQLGLFGMRLVGSDGRKLVYSTFLDLDVKQRTAGSLAFKNYNEDGSAVPADQLLVAPGEPPRVLIDGAHGLFVYCVPVSSGPTGGVSQTGTLAFYVSSRDLLSRLAFSEGFPVDQVSLVDNEGILINGPAASKTVTEALVSIWQRNAGSPSFASSLSLTSTGGATESYRAFSTRLSQGGIASMLVPTSRFEMTEFMKGLLLATFFFTVFLLLYLLLNLRSDPLEVLRQRVKRFQIQLITELVGSPGGADWGKWRRELEARKDEITWQIQRGIGRVPGKKKPVIEEYMTKTWGEILDLISRRAETPPAPAVAAMDFTRLEALIKTALQNANLALPAPRQAPPQGQRRHGVGVSKGAGGPAASAPPAAMQSSAAEDLEEAEAVEEAEAAEEAEGVEEEAEPVEEAVPAEEAEGVEEAEPVEEADPVEDAESVNEAEPVEDADRTEEAEAAEQAEALEEAQPAEEAEEVEDAEASEAETFIEASEIDDNFPGALVGRGQQAPALVATLDTELGEEAEPVEDAEMAVEAEPVDEAEPIEEAEFIDGADLIENAEPAEEVDAELLLISKESTSTPRRGPGAREDLKKPAFASRTSVPPGGVTSPRKRNRRELHGRGLLKTAIADFVEIRIPHGGAARPAAGPSAGASDLERLPDGEDLEELVPLFQIQPLPPLPVEEGLEMLPPADDGKRESETSPMIPSDDYRSPIPPSEYEPEELEEFHDSSGDMIHARSVDLAELEELEAIEESPGAPDTVPSAAGSDGEQKSELAALVGAGKVTSWTIEDLGKLVEKGTSAIVMENGVFRIKDEVYSEADHLPGAQAGSALRELAQDVVGSAGKESKSGPAAGAPPEEAGMGGIGELLRDEDTLDLSQDLTVEKGLSTEQSLSFEREKSNPIRLRRKGLDYDEFLASYPRSFTHTTQMKSLVEVSRRVSAVSAGLFLKKSDGFVPDLTIGLSEKSVKASTFGPRDPIFSAFLMSRKAVAINRNPAEVRFLSTRFDQEDIRYMKRVLFVPAIFRGKEAYLLFSFSGETDISIESILSKLIVRSA